MLPRFLSGVKWFSLLLKYDMDLAEEAQLEGCGLCGAQLHQAHYQRKPRGGPAEMDEDDWRRFSFCCYVCRKRTTPVSFRFFGRRVYFGAIMVLISAMLGGVSPRRREALHRLCGADQRTLERWRQWWAEEFPQTDVWRIVSPRLALAGVPTDSIPRQLLRHFLQQGCSLARALRRVLRLLLPLTTLPRRGGPG